METLHRPYHNGCRQFNAVIRDPWLLPEDQIELPAPGDIPQAPNSTSTLMTILPPAIMIVGGVITGILSQNITIAIPMMIMGLGFPLANFLNRNAQNKKYAKAVLDRQTAYHQTLEKGKKHLDELVELQRSTLELEYPNPNQVVQIALARSKNRHLWWRRAYDPDFLSLRVGLGPAPTSFHVNPPRMININDPLMPDATQLLDSYRMANNMPILLDMKKTGSMVIQGRSKEDCYSVTRRLLADILVHHSPEDVRLGVMADYPDAAANWSWLKWAPHVHGGGNDTETRQVYLTEDQCYTFLRALKTEFTNRMEKRKQSMTEKVIFQPAIVVVLDDAGKVRQTPDVALIAERGFEVGIYCLFVGENMTPNSCRTRLSLQPTNTFLFEETWINKQSGVLKGVVETINILECEKMVRALAGLEVVGGKTSMVLPETVRITEVLGESPLSIDSIRNKWGDIPPNEEMACFPVGVYLDHDGARTLELDFRPQEEGGIAIGGQGDYNAFLIGTAGSGKSIFLQSLVLAAAHRYSPKILNFLFMDFKAGAAELQKLSTLPHVVGAINDLGPELAERALQALEFELVRRKQYFQQLGNPIGIWELNSRYPDKVLPHLLIVIDEFGKGIELFPDLTDKLFELGKQGRAFGMYFILANQEVVPAVDKLKSNVGWNIVLKVRRIDEMRLIDRNLPPPPGRGRGYLKSDKGNIVQFQGAFSGAHISTSSLKDLDEFSIYSFEADGSRKKIYTHHPVKQGDDQSGPVKTELDVLVDNMIKVTGELGIKPAQPIYLDPLKTNLQLQPIFENVPVYRLFSEGHWEKKGEASKKLIAPIGWLDIPSQCKQIPLEVDFNKGDGHLWVVGSPGSGKSKTLTTILYSITATHQPDEAQVYIIEYGSGALKVFENFPHVGAVLRINEQERLERLLHHLEEEMRHRASQDETRTISRPDIFLVVNNFAELRANYPDLSDQVARFVSGKSMGIHLIIASNRSSDVPRAISDNISRRLVLYLASRDDYYEVLGSRPTALSAKAEGRGYWVEDKNAGAIGECQVAESPAGNLKAIGMDMTKAAKGMACKTIEVLPDKVTFASLEKEFPKYSAGPEKLLVPIGYSYNTLDLLVNNWMDEIPQWLVLGPRQSGKTNFLLSLTASMRQMNLPDDEIIYMAFRRNRKIDNKKSEAGFPICTTEEEILSVLGKLAAEQEGNHPNRRTVLAIDDLPGILEPGREKVLAAFKPLVEHISQHCDLYLVMSGIREELQQLSSNPLGMNILRMLKTSRTGLMLSRDPLDVDWFGTQISPEQRKINFPVGRAFFVSKGKMTVVQTALSPLQTSE